MRSDLPADDRQARDSELKYDQSQACARRLQTEPSQLINRFAGYSPLRVVLSLCVLLFVYSAVSGCGSGTTAFTGGGVPIGGASLTGRVVAAANISIPAPDVAITVSATPTGGTTQVLHAVTDKNGRFAISNVLPAYANGSVQMVATPSTNDYHRQQIAFNITAGRSQQLLVTLPPASFDASKAASVTLSVTNPAIPTGGAVTVNGAVRDPSGASLSVTPALVLDGDFAQLNADGTIGVPSGVTSGTGSITAYWQGLRSDSQQLHVDPSGSSSPPTPPTLPQKLD